MSIAAAGVLRRAALNAFRLNSFGAAPAFRAAPARTLSAGPKKPAAELTFKEAWLSDPATYPIVVIISSPYPASVKQQNHDQKSTSLYRGPCDRGAVVSWESTSVAAPKGQKGLFERAFYESRLRGRPRDIYIPHSRGHRLLQLLHLLPLLLAGRAHHQDGAVAGH